MPKFSQSSLNKLATCDTPIQLIMNEVIKHIDITVIYGHRSTEEQDKLFEQGFSKLKGGKSKHNSKPSMAIDIAPVGKGGSINWNDKEAFYFLGGFVKGIAASMGYTIRWGGDWNGDNDFHDQTFMDLGHFEIVYK